MVLKVRSKVKALPGCPMSKCMGLLGGLWTPELLWSLSDGARRFSELRRDCAYISAKVLTSRLRDLEHRGVLTRTVMPTSPPSVEYALTALGQELLPAIRSIVEVGSRLLLRDAPQAGQLHGAEHA
jgi:DNA-binding HxlR family transcriptional regulator